MVQKALAMRVELMARECLGFAALELAEPVC